MIREGSFQDHIAQISAQTALASQAFTGQAFRATDEVVVPQHWLTDRTRSAVYLPIKVPSSRLRIEDISLSVNDRTLKIAVKPTSWTGVEMSGVALDAASRRYELMLSALEAHVGDIFESLVAAVHMSAGLACPYLSRADRCRFPGAQGASCLLEDHGF